MKPRPHKDLQGPRVPQRIVVPLYLVQSKHSFCKIKNRRKHLMKLELPYFLKKDIAKKKKEYYIQLFLINIHVKIHNKTLQKEFSNKFVII